MRKGKKGQHGARRGDRKLGDQVASVRGKGAFVGRDWLLRQRVAAASAPNPVGNNEAVFAGSLQFGAPGQPGQHLACAGSSQHSHLLVCTAGPALLARMHDVRRQGTRQLARRNLGSRVVLRCVQWHAGLGMIPAIDVHWCARCPATGAGPRQGGVVVRILCEARGA